MASRAVSLSLQATAVAMGVVGDLTLTGVEAATDSHLRLMAGAGVAEVVMKVVGAPSIIIDQLEVAAMAAVLVRIATSLPDQEVVAGRMMEIVDGEPIN